MAGEDLLDALAAFPARAVAGVAGGASVDARPVLGLAGVTGVLGDMRSDPPITELGHEVRRVEPSVAGERAAPADGQVGEIGRGKAFRDGRRPGRAPAHHPAVTIVHRRGAD